MSHFIRTDIKNGVCPSRSRLPHYLNTSIFHFSQRCVTNHLHVPSKWSEVYFEIQLELPDCSTGVEKCLIFCCCFFPPFVISIFSYAKCSCSCMWKRILCVTAVIFVSWNSACVVPTVKGLPQCEGFHCSSWSLYIMSYLATLNRL